ncbi:MAG: type II toxin-antitoxin system RelE/ParE family toxin [Ignavibacteria bacterium]|nr:type II toxin-antitoxin system RelE/ParE family toxin [Ignavibacteria bacterium]
MNFDVFSIPPFDRQLKRLVKKYPSLKNEFANLITSLEKKPEQGTPLGNNCYKIRIAINSKGKGKSGGARIITHIVISESAVYLLSIYDKNEKNTLTDKEISELLTLIG